MEIIYTALSALFSIAVLFIYTKLMGYREMSQLSMFDYVNGITIGSIAAELATAENIIPPFIAMTVYALCVYLISVTTNKSLTARRFITGKSLVLFDNEKFYTENMRKVHLDINEFLTQCRNSGYFNLADVQSAVMEFNGKISILPKSDKRPVNLSDMGIAPSADGLISNVIMCGKIMENNLKAAGVDLNWLSQNLKDLKVEDIFLATCDSNKKLNVYKFGSKSEKDTFFM